MATTRPSLRADDNSLGTWGSAARKSSSMRGVRDTQSVSAEALAMAKQILSSQGLNDGTTPSGGSARDVAHHALLQHLQQPTGSGSGSGSFHQRHVGARRTSVESLPEWEPQMRNFDSALLGLKIPQTQAQTQVPPAQLQQQQQLLQQQQLHTQYHQPNHHQPQLPQKLTASVSFMDAAAGADPQPQQVAGGGQPPPERLAPWLHLPEEEESVPPTPPLVGSVHQMSPRRNAVETLRLDVRRALEMVQENAKREMLAELEEAHEEEERFALENGGIDEDLVAAVGGGVGVGGLDSGALGSRQVSPLPALPAPVDSELLRAVETEVHDAADTDDDGFESMSNADMYSCCSGGSDTEETTRQAQAAAAAAATTTATAVPSSAVFTAPSFRYSGHEDLSKPDELYPPQYDRRRSASPAPAGVVAAPSGETGLSAAAADEFVEMSALVRETHAMQHQQKRSSDTQLASIQALQEQQHMTAQQMHDLRVAQMQQQAAMQDQYSAQQELLRLQQEDTRVRARQAEEDTRRMVEQIELEKQRGRVQAREAAAAAATAMAAASPSDHLVSTPSRHSPEPATPTRAAASPAQAQTYYTPNGKPYVFDPATGKSRWVKTTSVMSNSPARSLALSPGKATHGVIQLNIVVR